METKKKNSPRTEPWGTSTFRGQRDEVKCKIKEQTHSLRQRFLARTLQALHILFVAGFEINLLGNVHSDLSVIYIINK